MTASHLKNKDHSISSHAVVYSFHSSVHIHPIHRMEHTITYLPQGTCSRQIDIVLDDDRIRQVVFTGGCHGNLQGIASLLRGMPVREAIARLEGIDCRGKGTSCPDQLARALRQFTKQA